jgi:hypothetical protein
MAYINAPATVCRVFVESYQQLGPLRDPFAARGRSYTTV